MKITDAAFLLPAYNPTDAALGMTIESLRAQTQRADIVVVDDGSRIPIRDRLAAEPGVTILRLDRNAGITGALNHGLEHILAQGYRYVARIDCGDTCEPERVEKQFRFLEANRDIELVGSAARIVTPTGDLLYIYGEGDPAQLSRKLRNNAPMLHPTFFFRTSLIRRIGLYSTDYPAAEDYELLLRTNNGRNIACVDEALVSCVADPDGISLQNRNLQLRTRMKLQLQYFQPLKIESHIGLLRSLTIWAIPLRIWLPLKRAIKSIV